MRMDPNKILAAANLAPLPETGLDELERLFACMSGAAGPASLAHEDYTQRAGMFTTLPGEGSDREKLVRMFQTMPPMPGPQSQRPETVAVMAEGDRVMLLTRRDSADPATGQTTGVFTFNMFRVQDGKLIEHWDSSQPGGPPPGAGGPPGSGMLPPGGPPPGSH